MKLGALPEILLVGMGGLLGSVGRYALSGLVYRFVPAAVMPYGTMVVNVLGCLIIGLLGGLADARQVIGSGTRLFVFIGLLGGFTTFSTFGYETLALARDGEYLRAGANVVLTVFLCLLSVWVGHAIGRMA